MKWRTFFAAAILGAAAVLIPISPLSVQASASTLPTLRYFGEAADAYNSQTPYGDNDAAGHYVQSGDARLYYEVYGTGEPVLILHGGGVGTPYELGHLIDNIRGMGFQVIVMSTRGHGRSEIGHTPLSFAQRADDAETVLRAVTDKPAIILGFSDGAYTSYALDARYPGSVDRIIAIGAGTLRPGYFQTGGTWEDLKKMDPAFMAQQEKLAPEPKRLPQWFHDYMAFWSKASVGKEELSRVTAPTLLIAGDEDDHAPMATMVEAENYLPNSRLLIVPKAWHTAFLDNEAVVWAAIKPFLEGSASSLTPSRKVAYNEHFQYRT